MKKTLLVPAIAGTAAVLPLVLMEWWNRRGFPEGFPFVLFGLLWLLPAAGAFVLARPWALALRVGLLAVLVWGWGAILLDQLPCFLGVPNCD